MTPSLNELVARAKQHGETHSDSREIIDELCAALKRAYDRLTYDPAVDRD